MFTPFMKGEPMKNNARKMDIQKSSPSSTDEIKLDQYKSSDWFLQIALIVAVTLLVATCVIGVSKRNAALGDFPLKPFVFPMHRQQLYYGPQ